MKKIMLIAVTTLMATSSLAQRPPRFGGGGGARPPEGRPGGHVRPPARPDYGRPDHRPGGHVRPPGPPPRRPDFGRPHYPPPYRPDYRPDFRPDYRRQRHHWVRDPRGYVDFNNRKFAYFSQDYCGITHVRVQVYGDNLIVSDINILLENGRSQDVSYGTQMIYSGQSSPWVALNYPSCIDGFTVEARSEADFDNDDSYVQLIGHDGYQEVYMDNVIRVRDFNFYRGRRW